LLDYDETYVLKGCTEISNERKYYKPTFELKNSKKEVCIVQFLSEEVL